MMLIIMMLCAIDDVTNAYFDDILLVYGVVWFVAVAPFVVVVDDDMANVYYDSLLFLLIMM